MKSAPRPIPHHVLVQAVAETYQHTVALVAPSNATGAGAPFAGSPAHPRGHLWSGKSIYASPALGLSFHHRGVK